MCYLFFQPRALWHVALQRVTVKKGRLLVLSVQAPLKLMKTNKTNEKKKKFKWLAWFDKGKEKEKGMAFKISQGWSVYWEQVGMRFHEYGLNG